jgi:alpha-ketoglutarate-dependent taurine dioxygenase
LDEMLASPENLVGLSLQRGDQLWLNNRTVAHGRERYADSPGNRRQFQRIWVEAPAHAIRDDREDSRPPG